MIELTLLQGNEDTSAIIIVQFLARIHFQFALQKLFRVPLVKTFFIPSLQARALFSYTFHILCVWLLLCVFIYRVRSPPTTKARKWRNLIGWFTVGHGSEKDANLQISSTWSLCFFVKRIQNHHHIIKMVFPHSITNQNKLQQTIEESEKKLMKWICEMNRHRMEME